MRDTANEFAARSSGSPQLSKSRRQVHDRLNASQSEEYTHIYDKNKALNRKVDKKAAIVVLNAAACLDGCDDQLLPASFRALETELKFHPSLLGRITLAQTMALSLSCPFWGYLADRFSRKKIMSIGMVSWGLTTILLALASHVGHIIALRAMNGAFLGSIGPISQSIIADITPDMSRGFQFGLVQMCASGGRIIGGVVTTSVAFIHVGGLYGWRWTFLAVGILSCALGVIIGLFMNEFSREVVRLPSVLDNGGGTGEAGIEPSSEDKLIGQTGHMEAPNERLSFWRFLLSVFTESLGKPSVVLIVLEGIVGTIPWSALSFATMYFQYCGLSDIRAGCVAASLLLGAMIAGPIAGYIGDTVFVWSPNHGRPFMGQLSMLFRVPLLIIGFLLVPREPTSFGLLLAIFLAIGLSSIAGVVVNRPLLSDVVKPDHRATTFALVVAIEGAAGALLGAPLVGYLAESHFGYIKTTAHINEISYDMRHINAKALSHAITLLTAIPWTVSFFVYGLVHFTYGPDRNQLRILFLGFGLNVSWYTCQLVDSLLWNNLIPYFSDYFPHWCTESLIRIGDVLLHPLPFYFLIPYHRYVDLRIGLYAFLIERSYFIIVEGQPLGTGSTTNIIYDFRPHLPPRTFLLSQYLTNLGYLYCTISQINSSYIRVTFQITMLCIFLFTCIIHTDRWNHRKEKVRAFPLRFVGAEIDQQIAEQYALAFNAYSQRLHQELSDRMEAIMSPESRAQLLKNMPNFSEFKFGKIPAMPEGFAFDKNGLIVEGFAGPVVLVWDKLAAVFATLACKLQQLKLDFTLPVLPSLELPSLEELHAALPNIDLSELRTIRSILATVNALLRPAAEVETLAADVVQTASNALNDLGPRASINSSRESTDSAKESVTEFHESRELPTQPQPKGDDCVTPPSDSTSNQSVKSDPAWSEAVQLLRQLLRRHLPTT